MTSTIGQALLNYLCSDYWWTIGYPVYPTPEEKAQEEKTFGKVLVNYWRVWTTVMAFNFLLLVTSFCGLDDCWDFFLFRFFIFILV